ncbi:MAG: glycosyltransferase family 2 protein [Oscillospiraceae bacterium]|nr:glycosyltransferase family 2 protein [Oscillospiraceae bacterium]
MHQSGDALIRASHITGSAVVINQCDREDYAEFSTENGLVRMYSTTQRGLTKSRNLAISKSDADLCLLCDDDEVFVEGYEEAILSAYEQLPQADVIIFKMINRPASFSDEVQRLHFPKTMKVSSWQISFRRESILRSGVRFDELMGAGSGNGAEEELKFLTDCEKAKLQIYYVPVEIASVAQTESTWFAGFTDQFFYNRGATTRYILGVPMAALYGVYYVVKKRGMYASQISPGKALAAIFRGIKDNKIGKQAKKSA